MCVIGRACSGATGGHYGPGSDHDPVPQRRAVLEVHGTEGHPRETRPGLAKAIGVDRATVTRTLKGGSLGIVFVSQLLAAFHPDLAFEDFFDVVPIP